MDWCFLTIKLLLSLQVDHSKATTVCLRRNGYRELRNGSLNSRSCWNRREVVLCFSNAPPSALRFFCKNGVSETLLAVQLGKFGIVLLLLLWLFVVSAWATTGYPYGGVQSLSGYMLLFHQFNFVFTDSWINFYVSSRICFLGFRRKCVSGSEQTDEELLV